MYTYSECDHDRSTPNTHRSVHIYNFFLAALNIRWNHNWKKIKIYEIIHPLSQSLLLHQIPVPTYCIQFIIYREIESEITCRGARLTAISAFRWLQVTATRNANFSLTLIDFCAHFMSHLSARHITLRSSLPYGLMWSMKLRTLS